jgi:hypothetical protein
MYLIAKTASGNLQNPLCQVLHSIIYCTLYFVCNSNFLNVGSLIAMQSCLSFSDRYKSCVLYAIVNHSANSVFLYVSNLAKVEIKAFQS